jgi:serine/threonine protein kinase
MVGLLRLSPGDVFAGDFEVRQILAKGGMGTVYAVFDRAAGEERALKVLLPELVADESSRRRFAQEARVAGDIPSEYVPHVHRAGIDEATGTPYIAMDLLRGHDLRRHVTDHGRLTVEQARPLLAQLAEALAAAHRVGLVHRDLKPENVFLDESDGVLRVKLLDFGVSKVLDAHRTSATGTAAVGSPMWMAPEQTSAGGRIAPATDVWALGLLVFYLLTGKLYWRTAHDGSGVAGLMREMHVDPMEPPTARAAQLAPDVRLPPGFDGWFLRATARRPSERFRDASEAFEALRPVLAPRERPVDRSALAFASTLELDRAELTRPRPSSPAPGAGAHPPRASATPSHPAPEPSQGRPGASPGAAPDPSGQAGSTPGAAPHASRGYAGSSSGAAGEPTGRGDRSTGPAPWAAASPAAPGAVHEPVGATPHGAESSSPWTPAWHEGAAASPGGPPRASAAAPPPRRGRSVILWGALLLVAGLAIALLTGVIVWVALTLTEPGRAAPPPEPAPVPAHPEPMEPLEVRP